MQDGIYGFSGGFRADSVSNISRIKNIRNVSKTCRFLRHKFSLGEVPLPITAPGLIAFMLLYMNSKGNYLSYQGSKIQMVVV